MMMSLLAISAAVVLAGSPVPESFEVQQLFRDGDSHAALVKAEACAGTSPKCRSLAELIREYVREQSKLEDPTADELLALVKLDREIAGSTPSAAARSLTERAIAAGYVEARSCRRSLYWKCAVHYALLVLKLDPAHAGARRIVSDADEEREREETFGVETFVGPNGPIVLIGSGDAPRGPDPSHLEVQQLFHDGDSAAALKKADTCATRNIKCRHLAELIREYDEKQARVDELGSSQLLALLRLDRAIAGGTPSVNGKAIISRVVATNFAKASDCRAREEWDCALSYAKNVLDADPGHIGAQTIVADARNKSKEIYLRAFQERGGILGPPLYQDDARGRIMLVSGGETGEAAPTTLKLDPTKSELYVKTSKDGIGSAFAHNHIITATNYSGTLTWDPVHLERCKLHVTVPVNDLVVDDPTARKKIGGDWGSEVSDGDRKSVRQNMLADIQLDAKKYPEITLDADNFKCRGSGQCELDGKLTLHGVTKAIHFSAKIKGDPPSGEGSLKFNTSDYGIKPYSAGLGTIKNKDEVELVFKLSASPAP